MHSADSISLLKLVLKNPWFIVASCAFSTANRPETVPVIFKYVLSDLEKAQADFKVSKEQAHQEKLLLARKMRDCLFKSGMVAGYSKVMRRLQPDKAYTF